MTCVFKFSKCFICCWYSKVEALQMSILTSLLVLFLICLYISSRALSKVFEHRKPIISAKVSLLVTMATILSETFIYIINYIMY